MEILQLWWLGHLSSLNCRKDIGSGKPLEPTFHFGPFSIWNVRNILVFESVVCNILTSLTSLGTSAVMLKKFLRCPSLNLELLLQMIDWLRGNFQVVEKWSSTRMIHGLQQFGSGTLGYLQWSQSHSRPWFEWNGNWVRLGDWGQHDQGRSPTQLPHEDSGYRMYGKFSVARTLREGNRVANALAKMGSEQDEKLINLVTAPDAVLDMLARIWQEWL